LKSKPSECANASFILSLIQELLNRFGQEGSQGREVEDHEGEVKSEGKMTGEEGKCQILNCTVKVSLLTYFFIPNQLCWKADSEARL